MHAPRQHFRWLLVQSLPICFSALLSFAQTNRQPNPQSKFEPAALVSPLIGTANSGNTFPGAVLPFGMVAFSPEELLPAPGRGIPPGGYAYDATQVRGFSLTHLSGAGCSGSGDFLFMPVTADVKESPALDMRDPAYLSDLRHGNEHAAAGYYSVQLGNNVTVELSATERTGAARFTYPAGQPATLLIRSSDNESISTDSQVAIDPDRRTVTTLITKSSLSRTSTSLSLLMERGRTRPLSRKAIRPAGVRQSKAETRRMKAHRDAAPEPMSHLPTRRAMPSKCALESLM
jgi:putative alpha-1,2-mannosidase